MSHRIFYDADCGFCRWSLGWILRWDRRRALTPIPLQDPIANDLLPHLGQAERMASWHLVSPDGEVRSGGSAAEPLFRLLPGGAPLAALAARLPGAVERVYDWVARHRGTLARPLGERARSRADAVIEARRAPREVPVYDRASGEVEGTRDPGGQR